MDHLSKAIDNVVDHPQGFGPGKTVPTIFEDQLFQPYYKTNERPFSCSDWANKNKTRGHSGIVSGFHYKNDEDASSFSFVDSKPNKTSYNKRPIGRTIPVNKGTIQKKVVTRRPQQHNNRHYNNGNKSYYRNNYRRREEFIRDSSVFVDPSWDLVEEVLFSEIVNQNVNAEISELTSVGNLYQINSFNRTTTKTPTLIEASPIVHEYNPTVSADPIMQDLVSKKTAKFYASERVISLLMATPHTVQPWDILVTKTENGIFLDGRPESVVNRVFCQETVSEFLPSDVDNINHNDNLSLESTSLVSQFTNMTINTSNDVIINDKSSPAFTNVPAGAVSSNVSYRYRKFDLGDDITLAVRTTVTGYEGTPAHHTLVSVKMFNEFDPNGAGNVGSVNYREKLDTQIGAVLTTEVKNNTCRVVRAAAETFISGADKIMIGWVSRITPRDNTRHVILRTSEYDPTNFAAIMRVQKSELFGNLKNILEFIDEQENGKYVVARDPNRPNVKIYSVEDDVFDSVTGQIRSE